MTLSYLVFIIIQLVVVIHLDQTQQIVTHKLVPVLVIQMLSETSVIDVQSIISVSAVEGAVHRAIAPPSTPQVNNAIATVHVYANQGLVEKNARDVFRNTLT